jgi:hypothetical protein
MNPVDELIKKALECRTQADVDHLEKELERKLGGAKVRYLGDRQTNWSALSSSVDPQAVLFERSTNMWDAELEFEAAKISSGQGTWGSPSEAAQSLLGVPPQGPPAMDVEPRRNLAKRCQIQILDSDDSSRRPTIGFRDHGIGLAPQEMPGTILSLEGSNKLDKPYLHGVFGKGGSVTCMFSHATVIISRKQPELLSEGEEDRVAIAVIREDDSPTARLPYFRYLVRPEDDLPYSVPAEEANFPPGTQVLHIGYQADRLGEQTWEKEESIYAFAETVLFRPTLPYELLDARTGDANARPEERQKPSVLQGLGQRLDRTKKSDGLLAASRLSHVPVPGLGDIGIRWWLFESVDRRRRRAAKGFVTLFVTGGQVHHAWSTQRFTSLVDGRRRVAQRILVEVDVEGIGQQDKVRIFSSFRDQLLKNPQAVALERAVADWLAEDADLDEAESKLTIEALSGAGGDVSSSLRDRLNRAVRARVPGLGGPGSGGGSGTNKRKPPKPKPEAELYPEPTSFTGPDRIEVLPGRRKTFHMQCNAVDGFVPDSGTVNVIAGVGSPPLQFGVGDLRRGRLQVSLIVAAEAPVGASELEVALAWSRVDGERAELRWPLAVEIVDEPKIPKPPRKGKNKGKRKHGDVAFIWASESQGWDNAMVGELQQIKGCDLAESHPKTYGDLKNVEDQIPTVVLNDKFKELAAYMDSIAPKVSDQALEMRKEKYALAVGVTVANMWVQEEKLRKAHRRWEEEKNGEEPERPMSEAQIQRALVEDARGVIVLLPEFDTAIGDVGQSEDEPAHEDPMPAAS